MDRKALKEIHAQAARASARQVYRDQMAHAQGAFEDEKAKIYERYQRELAKIERKFGA